MGKDEKDGISEKLTDFEEITVEEEPAQPVIEIAEQPEFYKIPKRFGTVPVDELPLGYVKGKGYSDKFPFIKLPFQKMEEIRFGAGNGDTNKIFWGDNLHIMRMLPSESIDLIYIDPPFFSGRNYNVIFGDQNEVRSFSDIWDGGLPTYLIWLNARLLEMKRLLKPTGSIYVHLDWHAVHYVKVEMDKIFGYNNFRNEIIWQYQAGSAKKKDFGRKHDTILRYSKTDVYFFNADAVREPYSTKTLERLKYRGAREKNISKVLERGGKIPTDVWYYPSIQGNTQEHIGYPTQKPEALLERIIKASSKEGDVVADFFVGGGTTAAVAEKLNRRWIVSDISRIAVEITKGRILKLIKERIDKLNTPNIEVLSWGYYDIPSLSKLGEEEFKKFILDAFGARKVSDPFISGLKSGIPVWVGPKDHDIEVDENPVLEFAEYLEKNYENRKKGIMIAWQFSDRAKQAQEMLAKMGAGIDFVSIDLVPIGSDNFKSHIVEKNAEYSSFLRFIMPPVVRLRTRRISERKYEFDFTESGSLNGGKIVNIQADFDFDGIFTPTTGFAITGGSTKQGGLILTQEFQKSGIIKIAFKIEDDQGGEALVVKELEVN
ncbi:MAG: hypothetical protein GPW19_00345 [Euryarchaeota archaeon]|nr:hypothetical protein [Euryarchaeota archaeon]